MQIDSVIWETINNNFCSYKVSTDTQNFCRNEYNVTGLCSRQSCPLANSRYATIRERSGVLYLYKKTIERAHTPAKLWEKIKLSKNCDTALQQVEDELMYWPNFLIHRNKQRLTKLSEVIQRSRRLALRTKTKLVAVSKKLEKREARREAKAQVAARLEQSIEKELMDRLRKGVYSEIMNESQDAFLKALDEIEQEQEVEFESEAEDVEELDREFVSDLSDDDEDDDIEDYYGGDGTDEEGLDSEQDDASEMSESEDEISKKRKQSKSQQPLKKKRGAWIEVEYEQEMESNVQQH